MSQPTQAQIFAALSAQSSGSFKRSQPSTSTFESLGPDALNQLTTSDGIKGKKTNSRRLICPRDGCGSVILLEGVGELIEVEGEVLPHDPTSPFASPSSPSPQYYWLIPTGPFAFENIGFSRPDKSNLNPLPAFTPKDIPGEIAGKVKYLICAECDLGPLGWSFDGGKAGWLDVRRLRYGEGKS
ncbi:hypothetical protein I302_103270 [Kwoniella bestiolae CBS 10118]|uniref:Mss4-like protein n=1 Tax=Kwoniella bestiolae CBS 10118 TaxID=1296100 RepID=A0AAJ8K5H2_9TREE